MGKNVITGDIEIEKHKFYSYKSPILENLNIDNVLASNKISSGEKSINTLLLTCMTITKLNHYI